MGLFSKKSSQAPPPPPAPPLPPQLQSQIQGEKPLQAKPRLPPPNSIGIGIETEFLLEPRSGNKDAKDVREFSREVARGYCQQIANDQQPHPRMHNAINDFYAGERYIEWTLDMDSTIAVPNKSDAPWGLECISPIFRAYPNSLWRNHVIIMWRYLTANYYVSANTSCGTHVHLSLAEGYSISNVKMIAQSIIHFEPAFEALLPKDRLGNEYARSNWIDNANFAYRGLSREQSIALIDKCYTIKEVVLLMNPNQDKYFGWNFLYILHNPKSTIEFRRGAGSTSVQDVFMWVELATSFIQAAIRIGTPQNLKKVPPTVGGFQWFLKRAELPNGVPGMNDLKSLNPLFSNKNSDDARPPKAVGKLSKEKAEKLKRKKLEDEKKMVISHKVNHPPYWD